VSGPAELEPENRQPGWHHQHRRPWQDNQGEAEQQDGHADHEDDHPPNLAEAKRRRPALYLFKHVPGVGFVRFRAPNLTTLSTERKGSHRRPAKRPTGWRFLREQAWIGLTSRDARRTLRENLPTMRTRPFVFLQVILCGWTLTALPLETKPDDPYFAKFSAVRAPTPAGLVLKPGDRLAICGDSITEQKMYSRILETYLTVCVPELEITVRQYGWSGERAPGFLARMTNDCLRFRPTIATSC